MKRDDDLGHVVNRSGHTVTTSSQGLRGRHSVFDIPITPALLILLVWIFDPVSSYSEQAEGLSAGKKKAKKGDDDSWIQRGPAPRERPGAVVRSLYIQQFELLGTTRGSSMLDYHTQLDTMRVAEVRGLLDNTTGHYIDPEYMRQLALPPYAAIAHYMDWYLLWTYLRIQNPDTLPPGSVYPSHPHIPAAVILDALDAYISDDDPDDVGAHGVLPLPWKLIPDLDLKPDPDLDSLDLFIFAWAIYLNNLNEIWIVLKIIYDMINFEVKITKTNSKQTIYNVRAKMKKKRMEGHNTVEEVLHQCNQQGYKCNTLLLEAVGMTPMGKTFTIATAFMRNEKLETYEWVL
ncbi:hypothetical protein M9H77_24416 [Catharanthus roseus]|uniref:Uncharacterized protein n=1 Tax=Catharanthus roseus TaxID=4058 RepID=A0ACC0B018_CATRO|nr:hypothetical protein M9H77_24416 [Catharanthus roseus]